jgi:hypothetical protein
MASARSSFSAPLAGRAPRALSIGATLRAYAAELAPVPDRWRRAARIAFVTALGAGLMAAMQLANPLGLTLLVNLAAPEFAFSLATGVTFLVVAAAIQLLMLFTVGATVDNPVIHLCAFIAFTGVTTYLIYGVPRLGRFWLWIQIPAVTAFYLVLFDQRALGSDSAQMFAGLAIAVTLLWFFNNVIWPQPAASILVSSIRSTLSRSRRRLTLLMAILVGNAPPSDDREVASKLAYHLTLLHPATRNAKGLREPAALLAAVIAEERLHHEIDRLAETAHRHADTTYDEAARAALLEAAAALGLAFDDFIAGIDRSSQVTPSAQADSLERFRGCVARLPPSLDPVSRHLVAIADLLAVNDAELPDASVPLPPRPRAHSPTFRLDKFLVRFCARHTVAMTLAFIAGLYDNSAALHAALWLLMIGGPPSHGATAKKFTMRAIGASGALLFAALAILVVSPNFTTLPPYMVAIFIGVLLITYVGEGGGQLSYLGIGATAFVIAVSGPGPRLDILGSLWTIWGVSLGLIIRAVISVISIERPNRTLAEEIERPVAALLRLVPDGAQRGGIVAPGEPPVPSGFQEELSIAANAQLQRPSAHIVAPNESPAPPGAATANEPRVIPGTVETKELQVSPGKAAPTESAVRPGIIAANELSLIARTVAANELAVMAGIQEILTVAADAQLQGPSAGIDARNLVDALDTMSRLAFALGNLSLHQPEPTTNDPAAVPANTPAGTNTFDRAVQSRLASWLANIRWQLEPGQLTPAPLRTMVSTANATHPEAPPPAPNATTTSSHLAAALQSDSAADDFELAFELLGASGSTSDVSARKHVAFLLRTLQHQLTTISVL